MIKKDTVIRTAILLLAIINQLLTAKGKCPLPIDDQELSELVSSIFTSVVSIWVWWKNNSFTKEAIEADNILKDKKVNKNEHN